jgi:hypothetical protein
MKEIHFLDYPGNKIFFELDNKWIEPICLGAQTQKYKNAAEFEKDIAVYDYVFILDYHYYEESDRIKEGLYVRWCGPYPGNWPANSHVTKVLGWSRELEDKYELEENRVPTHVWDSWRNE